MATETIPHGQAYCLVSDHPIRRQDRIEGAICPFCPIQLPPKNRKMRVTVDEDYNVISYELSSEQPLWKRPWFTALDVVLVLMIIAAIIGRS